VPLWYLHPLDMEVGYEDGIYLFSKIFDGPIFYTFGGASKLTFGTFY